MKKTKLLVASILASSLVLSNVATLSAYAQTEKTTLSEDVTAPVVDLGSLKVDKKDAKTNDTVTVSIKASDDKSGINYFCATFTNSIDSSNKYVSFKLNPETGLYEGKFYVNDSMISATWTISQINCSDYNFNGVIYSSSEYNFSNADITVTRVEPTLDLSTLKIDKKDLVPDDLACITVSPSEDSKNINDINICYKSPITAQEKYVTFNYDPERNVFEGYINIGEYSEYGLWTIKDIQICDNNYKYYHMNCADYDFSNADFNVTNDNADFTAPTLNLDSLKINKKGVQAGDTITASVEATDDKSGINSIQLYFNSSVTSEEKEMQLHYNRKSGFYEDNLVIDEDMESGDWTLNKIIICDGASNIVIMKTPDYDLSTGNFTVNNDKDKSEDVTAPNLNLESLKIDNKDVKPNDTINVSLNATDDYSGISYICLCYKAPVSNELKNLYLSYNSETKLYEGRLNINDYMENGTWTIDSIELSDIAHNKVILAHSDYDFSNASFNVNDSTNLDITAPIVDLNSLKVDKKNVSINDTVTVSVKATDDKTGISSLVIIYKSPLNDWDHDKYLVLNYNPETDLYEVTIDIDSSMLNGTWSIREISAYDNANNSSFLPFFYDYDFSNADFTVNA